MGPSVSRSWSLETLYFQRSRILGLRGGGIIAAAYQNQGIVRREHAYLVGVDTAIDIRGLLHLRTDRAVRADGMNRHRAGDVVCGQDIPTHEIDRHVDRPRLDRHWGAERRQGTRPAVDMKRGQMVFAVGFVHRNEIAGRDVQHRQPGMPPHVLHQCRQCHAALFGQRRGGDVRPPPGQRRAHGVVIQRSRRFGGGQSDPRRGNRERGQYGAASYRHERFLFCFPRFSTLTSPGSIKSGTVQPFRSYSAMHDPAKSFHRSASPEASASKSA